MLTTDRSFPSISPDASLSGVSWAAIFAGAFAIAALSLILLVLGTGLGFSVISPWPHSGMSSSALGASAILWLILSQIVAAAVGGYLAGRLRTRWLTVHTDEVYFRDTAQGLIAWSVAAIFFAVFVATTLGKTAAVTATAASVASSGLAASAGPAMTHIESVGDSSGRINEHGQNGDGMSNDRMEKYMVDSLFRTDQASGAGDGNSDSAIRLEVSRIFINSARADKLPAPDQQYIAHVVSKRTGLSATDADKRVSDVFTAMHTNVVNAENYAREVVEAARKTAAHSALWMFVALLCGAFIASLAATFGGRQRDEVVHINTDA